MTIETMRQNEAGLFRECAEAFTCAQEGENPNSEEIVRLAPLLGDFAMNLNTGRIGLDKKQDTSFNLGDDIKVLGMPKTDANVQVDKIETAFSSKYNRAEYEANFALRGLGLVEMILVTEALEVDPIDLIAGTSVLFGQTILDVGCGPGRFTSIFTRNGALVTATDQTMAYLKIAEDLINELQTEGLECTTPAFIQCPGEDFPYADYKSGIILGMFGAFNHFRRVPLQAMGESINPNGSLISSWYGENDALVFTALKEKIIGLEGMFPYNPAIAQVRPTDGESIFLGSQEALQTVEKAIISALLQVNSDELTEGEVRAILKYLKEEFLPTKFYSPEQMINEFTSCGLDVSRPVGMLGVSACFPKDPTNGNINLYLQFVKYRFGSKVSEYLSQFATIEEVLFAAILLDTMPNFQEDLSQFAYFFVSAKKFNS